ncbi:MAG: type II toxin-antitoxin system RelB/DinJ family antitoxin [Candidatus Yonathbacteria bacterium]|nr:type II toxin-antitoxin system RelB/DinJ family antitoxin [Candidatus Yonathbacteria bacterium]
MTTLNVRIDENVKEKAMQILAARGLNLSTGINVFLRQVIEEKGLPFIPGDSALLRGKYDREVLLAKKERHIKTQKACS